MRIECTRLMLGRESRMLNRCEFIGNLGADPEIKAFSNGGKIANLRLAVSKKWKDREGQQKEATEWISLVVNGDGLVGVVERFLRKGSKIYAAGEYRTRKFQDRDGNDRYSTEIVIGGHGGMIEMLDGPQQGGQRDSASGGQSGGGGWSSSGGGGQTSVWGEDLDDPVPF